MMKLLILLVIVVGVIAVAQLSKVYRLSADLRGHKEEDISEADTKMQGSLMIIFMIVFYATTIWQIVRYGDYLPPSASEHGNDVDTLMHYNLYLILAVFFIVNTLLFVFANKYRYDKNRKAHFFHHDNKLELIWTIVPSIVLAVIIIYGLRTWVDMTGPASDDAIRIEVYSKQFDWTVRYSGDDGEFGVSDFNLITPTNPLGIITHDGIISSLSDIDEKIAVLQSELDHERGHLLDELGSIELKTSPEIDHGSHSESHSMSEEAHAHLVSRMLAINEMLDSDNVTILTDNTYELKTEKIYRLNRHRQRILELKEFTIAEGLSAWSAGEDDRIVKGEFHLPLGREIEFVFRSRDVIHSAFMPHFRAQMNTVPGIPTRFKFTPTITTDSMRVILDDPEFDYVLLCNKICGSAHFNMSMNIIVETDEEYNAWLEEQAVYMSKEEN